MMVFRAAGQQVSVLGVPKGAKRVIVRQKQGAVSHPFAVGLLCGVNDGSVAIPSIFDVGGVCVGANFANIPLVFVAFPVEFFIML